MASHEISKFVDGSGDEFNFRDPTKESLANKVTSVRASTSATDINYPSEKAVAKAVESASVADKLYANQLWGGAFRASLSPGDVHFFIQRNAFFGAIASAITVEYSTDGGLTWIDYGLTDAQKISLFSQFNTTQIYCGKNSHIQPGYTGGIVGPKDLTNEMVPDQRLRVTISCMKSSSTKWLYARLRRFGIYIATNSAAATSIQGGKRHCVISLRTSNNVSAGVDTWEEIGDFNIAGDGGWNSIPCGNETADGGKVFGNASGQFQEIRMVFWSDGLSSTPASSQTGNLSVRNILAFSELIWEGTGINPNMTKYGMPCTVSSDGVANFNYGIKFTARKLKTNLARTSDSTFDGSADQLNIPVTGTLPVGNGGTGATTAIGAEYNILNQVADIDTTVDGDRKIALCNATKSASNGVFRWIKLNNIWTWIKGKLSSDSGVNISGNAATAGTADTAKAFDGSFTGTNSIAYALNGKSPTTHTHKTDAADVTSDDTNLGDAEDTMQFVTTDAAGYDSSHKPLYRRPALKIWNWIKSKLASDTGYINFAHSVASATNVNSHVLAGVVFADNSLHSCMFTFVMAVTFNFRESDECGGILKVDVGIGTGSFYVKNISLSNVTGALSVGDFNLVVGEVLNRKVVGVTWNGVLKGARYLRGTILSRYVAGDDTEFVYNDDVANGVTQAWTSARQWADDSAVVHIAGSETITGAKEFSRSGQDTNFTDSSGAESIVRARTATNSNNGSCQLDAYASGGKYGLYARNSGGTGKWVANLDNDGVVNLGSSGDDVRIGGTKFVFGASQLGTDSNTFYWV